MKITWQSWCLITISWSTDAGKIEADMATSPRSSPKVVPHPEPRLAVLYEPKDNEAEVE